MAISKLPVNAPDILFIIQGCVDIWLWTKTVCIHLVINHLTQMEFKFSLNLKAFKIKQKSNNVLRLDPTQLTKPPPKVKFIKFQISQ